MDVGASRRSRRLRIALSHPAVFVAGGIVLGLFPSVAKAGRRRVWIAYATFALSTVGVFLGLYAVFTHAQAAATLTTMQVPWAAAFPPLDDPLALARWLVTVHTGEHVRLSLRGRARSEQPDRVAVRRGGRPCSWYRGPKVIVLTCLAPFGLALGGRGDQTLSLRRRRRRIARAGHAIPGAEHLPAGRPRIGRPCWAYFRNPRRRLRVLRVGLVGARRDRNASRWLPRHSTLSARSMPREARQFARQFWPDFVRACRAGLPAVGPRSG